MEIYKDNLFVEMYTETEGHLHGFKKVLFEGKTEFQLMQIVDTYEYGRCLLLDGKMQSSQADEFIYHEFLVHPALTAHPDPKNVLIVGGGEGATLREVLRHQCVEQVDMVEIDGQVVSFAKEHLREWHQGSFEDVRSNIIIGDGRKYIEETSKSYDLIIIDISDPGDAGPAYLLYTVQFYELVKRRLKTSGMLALQAGTSSVIYGEIMASVYLTLQKVFGYVAAFEASVPSFDLPWGFCIAGNEVVPGDISQDEIDRRLLGRFVKDLRAYDGETHAGLFKTTKALRNLLCEKGRLIEDQKPIYTPL
ncbi:polyamine aminopropyltransferase [bacterium]|nr:polyamine aminopropyltransferase [bacterium]